MAEKVPIRRRLWRVAFVIATGGCAFAVGMLINKVPPKRVIAAGGIIILASTLLLIPVVFVMLRLERNNWRFSLRTLLLMTTLVALLLGTITYVAK
jgi:hypothetical protein